MKTIHDVKEELKSKYPRIKIKENLEGDITFLFHNLEYEYNEDQEFLDLCSKLQSDCDLTIEIQFNHYHTRNL